VKIDVAGDLCPAGPGAGAACGWPYILANKSGRPAVANSYSPRRWPAGHRARHEPWTPRLRRAQGHFRLNLLLLLARDRVAEDRPAKAGANIAEAGVGRIRVVPLAV